jgi:hypothetical protein
MNDQAERIHAALLRFKGDRPVASSQIQDFARGGMEGPRVVVVVDEKNLAALASPIVDLPRPKVPGLGKL